MRTLEEIKELQNIKSTSVWTGVSKQLQKRDIDVSKVIIAETFSEDVQQLYWSVVTFDKKIFEFYYDWLNKDVAEGEIIEWHDFTRNPEKVYLHESVQDVLENFDYLVS